MFSFSCLYLFLWYSFCHVTGMRAAVCHCISFMLVMSHPVLKVFSFSFLTTVNDQPGMLKKWYFTSFIDFSTRSLFFSSTASMESLSLR